MMAFRSNRFRRPDPILVLAVMVGVAVLLTVL